MKQFATPIISEDETALTNSVAAIKTATDKAATDLAALTTRVSAAETSIGTVKGTADKAATDLTALTTRVSALENPSSNNSSYLISGSPYTANSNIPLRGLVHIRPDGKIEPADDTANKTANGIVDAPIAGGAAGNVYGTGARFSAIGLSGTQPGAQLFTGSNGAVSLSSVGNGRLIQQIGIFKGGLYYFDFSDPGYWIEGV